MRVLAGPARGILCILDWFYRCFLKIDVRVCEGLPVFEFVIFSSLFLMISVKLVFIWVLYMLLETSFGQRRRNHDVWGGGSYPPPLCS